MASLKNLILVLLLTLQLAFPLSSLAETNLDLSSTNQSVSAQNLFSGNGQSSVVINVGGNSVTVDSNSMLTPAQYVAASQVLTGGNQALVLGSGGNATAGNFALSSFTNNLSGLVIPSGVSAVQDFGASSVLNLTGNLTNYGNLYALSTNSEVNTGSILAANVFNQQGALISSVLPAQGLAGYANALSSFSLNIQAINDIVNQGSIVSSANLNLVAGGSIINSSAQSTAILQAMNNLNMFSATGNIINSGIITAQLNNLNINSMLNSQINQSFTNTSIDLLVNNINGIMSAENGSINIRDQLFTEKGSSTLWGGDWLSQNLNVKSGDGIVTIYAQDISGMINVDAGIAHVTAATGNLQLGTFNLTGDPTFYNTAGDITFNQTITFNGQPLAIVASGNIIAQAGAGAINTLSTVAGIPGGSITLIAGANFVSSGLPAVGIPAFPAPVGPGDTTSTLTITPSANPGGGSLTGGRIDLTALSAPVILSSVGNNSNGGNITLIAFAGSDPLSGTISTGLAGKTISAGGSGAGNQNGTVTVIAGATTGTSISIAGIQTWSLNTVGGDILLATSTPIINGGIATILDGVLTGSFSAGTMQNASIFWGNATTVSLSGANITALAGQNMTTQSILGTATGAIRLVTLNGTMTLARIGQGVGTMPASIFIRSQGNLVADIIQCTNNTFNIISSSGSITLGGQIITNGGQIVIVAGSDISRTGSGNFNSLSSVAGVNAGNVFVASGLTTSYNINDTATFSITGLSASGGSINLPDWNVNASGNSSNGGNVEFYAFAGTGPASGTITQGTTVGILAPISAGGNGAAGVNGNVTLFAGAASGTTISMGGIQTAGANNSGGSINVTTAIPILNGTPVSVVAGVIPIGTITQGTLQANASISIGGSTSFQVKGDFTIQAGQNVTSTPTIMLVGSSVSPKALAILAGGNIISGGINTAINSSIFLRATTGDITLTGQTVNSSNSFITMVAGGSITIPGGIFAQGGGNLAVVAGGDIHSTAGGSISTSPTAAGNGGAIFLGAGLSTNPVSANAFQITGFTSSGGRLNLFGVATVNSTATGAGNAAGNITLIASNGTNPPSGTIITGAGTSVLANGGGATGTEGDILILAGATVGSGIVIGNGGVSSSNSTSVSNITIATATPVLNGSPVTITSSILPANTFSAGTTQAASITISGVVQSNGANISITSGNNLVLSGIFGILNQTSVTNAGTITLVMNSTTAFNTGSAGTNGTNTILNNVTGGAGGNGGTVTITNNGTGGIIVPSTNNIQVNPFVNGYGGRITLNAPNGNVGVANGFTLNGVGNGDGGQLTILTNSVSVFGVNSAGPNGINGTITANAGLNGAGGRVSITNLGTGGILLPNGTNITVNATGNGAGGWITLNATAGNVQVPVGNITANGIGSGAGGRIEITSGSATPFANGLNGIVGNLSATGGVLGGDGGTIIITANGTGGIILPSSKINVQSTGNGKGGTITVSALAGILQITGDLSASAAAAGSGNGGAINITYFDAANPLLLGAAGANSFISGKVTANAGFGATGGDITITNNANGPLQVINSDTLTVNSNTTPGNLNFNKVGQNVTVTNTGTMTGSVSSSGVNITIDNQAAAAVLVVRSIAATGTALISSDNGGTVRLLAGAPNTISAATNITIRATNINFDQNALVTSTGAGLVALGSTFGSDLTINLPATGGNAAVSTTGGTITVTPAVGRKLIFNAAAASTLRFLGGNTTTTTSNAGTDVSANVSLTSDANLTFNVHNATFSNNGAISSSAVNGNLAISGTSGDLTVNGAGSLSATNLNVSSTSGFVNFSQSTVTGTLSGSALNAFTASTTVSNLSVLNLASTNNAITVSSAGNLTVVQNAVITARQNINLTAQNLLTIGQAAGLAVSMTAGALQVGLSIVSTNMSDYTFAGILSTGAVNITSNTGNLILGDNVSIFSIGNSINLISPNTISIGSGGNLFAQGGNITMDAGVSVAIPNNATLNAVARSLTTGTVTIDGQTIPDFNGGGIAIWAGFPGTNLNTVLRNDALARVSAGTNNVSAGVNLTGSTMNYSNGQYVDMIATGAGKIGAVNTTFTVNGGVLSIDPPGDTIDLSGSFLTIIGPALAAPTPSSSGSTTTTLASATPVLVAPSVSTPSTSSSSIVLNVDTINTNNSVQTQPNGPDVNQQILTPITSVDGTKTFVVANGSCQSFMFTDDDDATILGQGGTTFAVESPDTIELKTGKLIAIPGKKALSVKTVQGKVIIGANNAAMIQQSDSGVVRVTSLSGNQTSLDVASDSNNANTIAINNGEEVVLADEGIAEEELIPVDGVDREQAISGAIIATGKISQRNKLNKEQLFMRDMLLQCVYDDKKDKENAKMSKLKRDMLKDISTTPQNNLENNKLEKDKNNTPNKFGFKLDMNKQLLMPVGYFVPESNQIAYANMPSVEIDSAKLFHGPKTRFTIDGDDIISLASGDALIEASEPTVINCFNNKLYMSPGTVALLSNRDGVFKVINLYETHCGSIKILVGKKHFNLCVGQEVLIGKDITSSNCLANDLPIGRRRTRNIKLKSGLELVRSEYSHVSLMQQHDLLSKLMHSPKKDDQKLADKLIKMAACITQTTSKHGPFSTPGH